MGLTRFQEWLHAAPLSDPIERRLSPLIQFVLIALSAAAAATVVMGLVTRGAAALRLEALAPTLLFLAAMLLALAFLRSGHFKTALWIITGATLIAQARNTLSADLNTIGIAILMAYAIPLALAGLLINRRALLLTLAISAFIVHVTALRDMPNPGLATSITLFFLIIFGLLSFFLGLFNSTFRAELANSLARADELAQLSDRLHVTLTSIGDAVITTDDTGHVLLLNTAAQQLTGWTQAEAAGQPLHMVFRIINEATREPVESPVDKVLREGTVVGLANHTILLTKDGREVPIDDSGAPIRNRAGTIVGVVLVFRDISERYAAEQKAERLYAAEMQARQEAEQSRRQVAQILESITDAYYGLDREWKFTYVNQTAERILERKRETLLGKSIWEEFAPALNTPLHAAYERALREGVTVGLEFYYPPLRSWFDVRAYPSKDGLFVYFRTINDRKAREAAEHEQRLLAESQRDTAIAINSTLDLNEVLDRILESVRRVVPNDAGLVLLVEDGLASVQRTRGLDFDPALREQTETMNLPVTETAALREIIERREPLIIPDVSVYPGWVRVGNPHEPPIFLSFIGTPVYLRDELIGFINLFCRESHYFTPAHAERMRLFAEAIATAIQNARLFQQAQEVAAYEERQRLARDLHDAVSQTLFSATTVAEALPRLWQRNPQKTMEQLDQLVLLNRAAMAEMRTLLLELRPEAIVNTKLTKLLTQLVEVAKGRKRLTGELIIRGELGALPPGVHLAFYRIAQESLNNILKHSQATQFQVLVEREPDRLYLHVQDNGRGFDLAQAAGGLGLSTMQERAEAIGAALEMSSRPNQGTDVKVTWLDTGSRRLAAGE